MSSIHIKDKDNNINECNINKTNNTGVLGPNIVNKMSSHKWVKLAKEFALINNYLKNNKDSIEALSDEEKKDYYKVHQKIVPIISDVNKNYDQRFGSLLKLSDKITHFVISLFKGPIITDGAINYISEIHRQNMNLIWPNFDLNAMQGVNIVIPNKAKNKSDSSENEIKESESSDAEEIEKEKSEAEEEYFDAYEDFDEEEYFDAELGEEEISQAFQSEILPQNFTNLESNINAEKLEETNEKNSDSAELILKRKLEFIRHVKEEPIDENKILKYWHCLGLEDKVLLDFSESELSGLKEAFSVEILKLHLILKFTENLTLDEFKRLSSSIPMNIKEALINFETQNSLRSKEFFVALFNSLKDLNEYEWVFIVAYGSNNNEEFLKNLSLIRENTIVTLVLDNESKKLRELNHEIDQLYNQKRESVPELQYEVEEVINDKKTQRRERTLIAYELISDMINKTYAIKKLINNPTTSQTILSLLKGHIQSVKVINDDEIEITLDKAITGILDLSNLTDGDGNPIPPGVQTIVNRFSSPLLLIEQKLVLKRDRDNKKEGRGNKIECIPPIKIKTSDIETGIQYIQAGKFPSRLDIGLKDSELSYRASYALYGLSWFEKYKNLYNGIKGNELICDLGADLIPELFKETETPL